MLKRILKVFREVREPINLKDLSQKLGIEKNALEGMLEFLIRKNYLKVLDNACRGCSFPCEKSSNREKSSSGRVYILKRRG